MKKEYTLALLLFCYFSNTATTQSLLKDINTTTLSTYFGSSAAVLNGTAFFGANAGNGTGHELWKTDGNTGGTVLVKDIYPGDSDGSPSNFLALTDKILFTAKDDMFGGEKIFTSDGTAAGTLPLLFDNQIITGAQFVQANGFGYFTMTNPSLGTSLMQTDGTVQGTMQWSGTEPFASIIERPVIVGNVAYYISLSSDYTYTLIRTDGTLQGTINLKTLMQPNSMFGLTAAGNTVYFWASTPDEGFALWKSDGSVAGTVLVTDLEPGQTGGTPTKWASTSDYLFFIKDSGAGSVCWRTDGTAAGTIDIGGIIPYAATVFISGTTVYVSASALYASSFDGPLQPILNMNQGVQTIEAGSMVDLNGKLYFVAVDEDHGKEVWVSDGTAAGTQLVGDINPGPADSNAKPAFILNNQSYWVAFHLLWGSELWSADETGTDLNLRVDLNTNTNSSSSGDFETFGVVTLFPADDGVTGVELWRHFPDDNSVSTIDINPGPSYSLPALFTRLDDKVIFQATDSIHGNELWAYDLQNHQIGLLADLNPGTNSSAPNNFTLCDGKVLFNTALLSPNKVYVTDGTPAGTVDMGDNSNFAFYSPVCLQNDLFFSTGNADLYKINDSGGGITLVRNFDGSSGLGYVAHLTEFDNRIFFSAPDAGHGQELWVSDGTPAGTVLFMDIVAGATGSVPENLTAVDGLLYFTALNSNFGTDLWKTDGTAAGTVQIIEIIPPATNFITGSFRKGGGRLYFMRGNSDGFFVSLWRSDGTASGTFSFHQFGRSIYDTELFPLGSSVYFNGHDDLNGAELWKSDGTVAGTTLVHDICPGTCSGDPRNFAVSDSLLYFTSYHFSFGREPWSMNIGTSSTSTPEGAPGIRMKIQGNPAQSGAGIGINLHVPDPVSTVFQLYDITGRIVWQKVESSMEGENIYQFLLPVLSPGMYLLQATAGPDRMVEKIVIAR